MDISQVSENLKPGAFIRLAASRIRELSEARYPHMRFNVRSRLMQCWCGPSPSEHYEVWLHERLNKVELGLHFESSPAANQANYEYLDAHLLEIQEKLGSTIWLEHWDRGWVRLYETAPMLPLDLVKVEDVAARLCEIIDAVQPLIETVDHSRPAAPDRESGLKRGSTR